MADKAAYPLLTRIRNRVHRHLVESIRLYYIHVWGMRIGKGTRLSLTAKLDKTNPKGMVIGDHTFLTFGATVLTHDFVGRRHLETRIGSYCFIGARSMIMPGVTIGDHSIVGAMTLVREDVPPRSLVVGNPGRVVRTGLVTTRWGMIPREGEALSPWLDAELAREAAEADAADGAVAGGDAPQSGRNGDPGGDPR